MTELRLTYKGEPTETLFVLSVGSDGKKLLYSALDENKRLQIEIGEDESWKLNDNCYNLFEESRSVIDERLLGVYGEWIENISQGVEADSIIPANPTTVTDLRTEDIFVELKPFSLKQLVDLIDDGDLEIRPNFQRNFIWDKTRQSRLIESILMGLPLPACYFSQYKDGCLTVVDGLQRLRTIHKFWKNELALCNLEYLKDCEGKTYQELKNGILSPLRIRRFSQTQLMCFAIDYRSPSRLKYDLFRRLNTGSKPLNSQEIRNCLSRKPLQDMLAEIIKSPEFTTVTDNSIKNTRLEAHEIVLRFIYFYKQYTPEKPTGDYDSNMEDCLNQLVETLNQITDYEKYIVPFKQALSMSYHLFGKNAFRKVTGSMRSPINKTLMTCITVLLAHNLNRYKMPQDRDTLTEPLMQKISKKPEFFNAITYGTNNTTKISRVFTNLTELFDSYLLQ